MSQYDFGSIDPTVTSGTALADILNAWQPALESNHIGPVSPSYAKLGMMYWRQDAQTSWNYLFHDGVYENAVLNFNPTTRKLEFEGAFYADSQSYFLVDGGKPTITFGAGTVLYYDRAQNTRVYEQAGVYRERIAQVINWSDSFGFVRAQVGDDGGNNGLLPWAFNIIGGDNSGGNTLQLQNQGGLYGPMITFIKENSKAWGIGLRDSQDFIVYEDYQGNADLGIARLNVSNGSAGGGVYITGNLTQNYSDARLKKDLEPIEPQEAWNFIECAHAYRFGWNELGLAVQDVTAKEREVGFITQEVEQVLAEAVVPQVINADRWPGMDFKTLRDRPMIAYHHAALADVQARLNALEALLQP